MYQTRRQRELEFTFSAGATASTGQVDLENGCFGSLLVPTGSDLIGKTLQIVAHPSTTGKYAATNLLGTPKLLAAGNNAFTDAELLSIAGAGLVSFLVNSAVTNASSCVLLWKS